MNRQKFGEASCGGAKIRRERGSPAARALPRSAPHPGKADDPIDIPGLCQRMPAARGSSAEACLARAFDGGEDAPAEIRRRRQTFRHRCNACGTRVSVVDERAPFEIAIVIRASPARATRKNTLWLPPRDVPIRSRRSAPQRVAIAWSPGTFSSSGTGPPGFT